MKKSLKDTLLLKPKVEIKKSEINLKATEKAVAKIHQDEIQTVFIPLVEPVYTPEPLPAKETSVPKAAVVPIKTSSVIPARKNAKAAIATPLQAPEIEQERTKRVTLDIPITMHTAIKMKTFRESITIREYLLSLAANDLG
jgi:hypothetical protein